MIHDPIADMLTRIRNSLARKHRFCDVLYSKINTNILNVIVEAGFVEKIIVNKEKRLIRVYLKYDFNRVPLITNLKRESSPGRRRYVNATNLPVLRRGLGKAIVSTSKGVMCSEKARKENVGGELVCSVW